MSHESDTSDARTAGGKTALLGRLMVTTESLIPNPSNPNVMTDAQFNMLCDNIEKVGLTDPILVRPIPESEGKYRIVGGHHRWEVAKLYGIPEVPVTVITDPEFTEDEENFQMIRHNVIHGRINPEKFIKMYESLQAKYSKDIAAEMFGFADEADFEKLISRTASTLPPEMKVSFKKAAKEIKTIDDLATLLNRMFTEYGDTLSHGYMIVDYGKKKSVWLRMEGHQYKHFLAIAEDCRGANRTVDHFMAEVFRSLVSGDLSDKIADIMAKCPVVEATVPEGSIPTLDSMG